MRGDLGKPDAEKPELSWSAGFTIGRSQPRTRESLLRRIFGEKKYGFGTNRSCAAKDKAALQVEAIFLILKGCVRITPVFRGGE